MDYGITIEEINLLSDDEKKMVMDFLATLNLKYEESDYTIVLRDGDKIIATGSVKGEILKCIGIDPEYQGYNLSEKIVNQLINWQLSNNIEHRFVFTKSDNVDTFVAFGFKKIAEVYPYIVLLEGGKGGIEEFIEQLRKETPEEFLNKEAASIVVNCNPITKGHLYLINYVAERHEVLHLFVVSEDRSLFPNEVRYKLVKEATKNLKNVVVHRGGKYVISSATFPAYFLRSGDETKLQTKLDVHIFGKHLAKGLNIKYRYVAEEPYCPVTRTYNESMKEVLPLYDVQLIEIKRHTVNGEIISASKVREAIRRDDWDLIREMVPDATWNFLQSDEAKPIIEKIKRSKSRH